MSKALIDVIYVRMDDVRMVQGRFEILSVSGSFLVTESGDGTRSRTGGLSVSLAGPDGRVIGGSVAGALIAATPVQVPFLLSHRLCILY
jgi:hypothetical protein